ncbi:MAG TPA: ribose-phosphate diphosphokinase [bacterium]
MRPGAVREADVVVASCRAAAAFATGLRRASARLPKARGRARFIDGVDYSFPDGEVGARLDAGVDGCDVFLLQSLVSPGAAGGVQEQALALLVAARACREWGAARVTAVTPYLAYARQDKPTAGAREPTTARLFADLAAAAGIDRLVTWHPHCAQVHGFFAPLPVVAPDPLDDFVHAFARFRGRGDAIAVAPDAGAAPLVGRFARALGLRSAVAMKRRPERGRAEITEIAGNFTGARVAIVLDDMISSGSTLREVARALAAKTWVEEIRVAVSHNLCLREARETLEELYHRGRLAAVSATDSIPQTEEFTRLSFFEVRPLAPRFAALVLASVLLP